MPHRSKSAKAWHTTAPAPVHVCSRCIIAGTLPTVKHVLQERHPSMAEFAGIADDSFQVLPYPPQRSALSAFMCVMAPCRVCLNYLTA
jgi:hypothetical protein